MGTRLNSVTCRMVELFISTAVETNVSLNKFTLFSLSEGRLAMSDSLHPVPKINESVFYSAITIFPTRTDFAHPWV